MRYTSLTNTPRRAFSCASRRQDCSLFSSYTRSLYTYRVVESQSQGSSRNRPKKEEGKREESAQPPTASMHGMFHRASDIRSHDANAIPRARLNGLTLPAGILFSATRHGGWEINQFPVCLMFQLYQSNTRAVSRCVVSSAATLRRRSRRHSASGVDPGARFRSARHTIDNEAYSRRCKRSVGSGTRVKSQPAAMGWRRPVLIRFPGKTLPPKCFTMEHFTCARQSVGPLARCTSIYIYANEYRRATVEFFQTPRAECNLHSAGKDTAPCINVYCGGNCISCAWGSLNAATLDLPSPSSTPSACGRKINGGCDDAHADTIAAGVFI